MDDKKYYSYDFWFNNELHDSWDNGGENYYVNTFIIILSKNLEDIPSEGKILVLEPIIVYHLINYVNISVMIDVSVMIYIIPKITQMLLKTVWN